MKKILFTIVLSFCCAISVFSQDTIREGNLIYVRDHRGIVQSLSSTKIEKESCVEAYITGLPWDKKELNNLLYKTIFSKSRATELGKSKYVIRCTLNFDVIKKQLCFVSFNVGKEKLLLTLDELKRIEDKFKAVKYNYFIKCDAKIAQFTQITGWLDFTNLY